MKIENTPEGFERYKFTRERLSGKMMYRRERQWKVLSWVSSLFLAIIGGVIALSSGEVILGPLHKLGLTIAVLAFSFFAWRRITHDQSVAGAYSKECFKLGEQFDLEFNDKWAKKPHTSHRGFLVALAIITILVVLVLGSTGAGA